jgi:hypothetical protein
MRMLSKVSGDARAHFTPVPATRLHRLRLKLYRAAPLPPSFPPTLASGQS